MRSTPPAGPVAARTRLLLEAPVVPTLLRLAAPTVFVTVLQAAVGTLDAVFVGWLGPSALAGVSLVYPLLMLMQTMSAGGMGARLEYLQILIAFGMGSALVALVGANVGAGQIARAERIAWTGAGIAAGVTGAIGLFAAVFPSAWLGLFTADPEVIVAGTAYLRIVGPVYGFFGLGMALYFASQGAGRLGWPLTAGFARLFLAAAGGWLGDYWLGWGLPGIFAAMAAALIVLGGTIAAAIKWGAWR
jgi:Na+-driven multidrug efflux pump